MSKLNRTVEIDIGGELRKCKFTIGAIEQLESILPEHNIFMLMEKQPWSMNEIISACWCGLRVFDAKLTRQKVAEWVTEYAQDEAKGIVDLHVRLTACLGLSGLAGGDAGAYADVLNTIDGKEDSAEPGK